MKIVWIFILNLLLSASLAQAGGVGSTGGGGGVICFQDQATASKYEKQIQQGSVSKEMLDSSTRLTTLDRWESEVTDPNSLMTSKDGDWKAILQKAHENLFLASPLFSYRMKQAANLANFAEWKASEKLAYFQDALPSRPIPENCKLIQLALRYSEGNNVLGEGPAQKFVKVRVNFNTLLFDRLDSLDQAMLVFHEQLYILGQSIGHDTSNSIRPFVIFFFYDKPFTNRNPIVSYEGVFTIRFHLIRLFGDYAIYFVKENMPASVDKLASKPYSTTSRFATFIRLLQTSREKLTTCKKTKSHSVCMEEVMNPLNQGHLNKEEAFVYTAFFGLDRSQGLMNSEFLMHPYLDKEHSRFDQKAVQLACKLIDENISNTFDFAIKALQYCTDMSTATKGTDQN